MAARGPVKKPDRGKRPIIKMCWDYAETGIVRGSFYIQIKSPLSIFIFDKYMFDIINTAQLNLRSLRTNHNR